MKNLKLFMALTLLAVGAVQMDAAPKGMSNSSTKSASQAQPTLSTQDQKDLDSIKASFKQAKGPIITLQAELEKYQASHNASDVKSPDIDKVLTSLPDLDTSFKKLRPKLAIYQKAGSMKKLKPSDLDKAMDQMGSLKPNLTKLKNYLKKEVAEAKIQDDDEIVVGLILLTLTYIRYIII